MSFYDQYEQPAILAGRLQKLEAENATLRAQAKRLERDLEIELERATYYRTEWQALRIRLDEIEAAQ